MKRHQIIELVGRDFGRIEKRQTYGFGSAVERYGFGSAEERRKATTSSSSSSTKMSTTTTSTGKTSVKDHELFYYCENDCENYLFYFDEQKDEHITDNLEYLKDNVKYIIKDNVEYFNVQLLLDENNHVELSF
jgi:hypothetical protein